VTRLTRVTRTTGAPGRTAARRSSRYERVLALGQSMPGVSAELKYDGTLVLKIDGCFMAGLATHATAEPDSLVVRMDDDARAALIEDDGDTYYAPPYYARHPVVLARLSRLDTSALRDLLSVSRRLTHRKARRLRPLAG
jgi:hypothetical protein